jgi:hypothetical protein
MLKTSQEEAFDAARVTLYSFLFLTCEDRYSVGKTSPVPANVPTTVPILPFISLSNF